MGADQKQIYWKVIFPASLPELISGMKQGWSFAWRALMSWRSNDDIHRTWPDINDREKSCRHQSGYARHVVIVVVGI